MSPRTPIRPGTSGTGQPDLPAIRLPEISPAIRNRLPGTGTPVLPSAPESTPPARPAAAPVAGVPGTAAPIAISNIAGPVANSLSPGRPLSAYSRHAPKGLPPPDSDGFRVAQQRKFVNLEDGQVVMVGYDESVRSYCAQAREEYRPSGPALYRVAGRDIWKENSAATALRPYQLPAQHPATPQPARTPTADGGHPDEIANDSALLQCRGRLVADAERFFKNHKLPDRPPVPELPPAASDRVLIETLYRQAEGLVIGETYTDSGSKLFLIKNMATLAEQGVRTLYLERLRTDVEQAHLETFHKTGALSDTLDNYLRTLDGDYGNAPAGTCSYRNLIITARAHDIRVQALDCAASNSLRVRDPHMLTRITALNYHTYQVIKADQAGGLQGKWLALVDTHHANGYGPEGTPGLSRLQGVTGLMIDDTMSNPAIHKVPALPHNAGGRMNLVRPDLKLSVKVPWREALEVPLPYRNALQDRIRSPEDIIVRRTHVRLDERVKDAGAIADFLQREERLKSTSAAFFSRHHGSRQAKPEIPHLPADSTVSRILERLYENNNGLVLGADQGSITARKLLIENMRTLSTLKVEKLYVQNLLTDLDQPFIDGFHATGVMPRHFEQTLASEDLRQTLGLGNEYSLQRLLSSAREHGIKIQALDMASGYRKQKQQHNVPNFNYIAHKIIESDQQHHGAHKWLALVLNVHASTVRGVPGLAQLQGAPGLRTVATGPQATAKISADPGYVEHVYGRDEYVRSDLALEVNLDSSPRPPSAQNPRNCLGWMEVEPDFLIEKQGNHFILVQRSYRTGADHYEESIIQVRDGKYSIPQGAALFNGVQYNSLADLVWGLKGSGYVQVAELPGVIPIPATPRLDTHPQLNRPGMFLTDETANGPVLVNRSKDRSLTVTPIRRNPAGKWYINHKRWGYDETRLFDSLDELGSHLIKHVGLVAYSAPSDL
ncbi:membrane-targeted effector domain-containing toxin [Pseudomonas gingeri]|uniref:membrane-targeted effector domain-containing toxin n=1 Tax=Pseudomonas gingeri TaxID=117681 RepID=UPI002108C0FA|nr:membrane-targeted effector domain-containing toxin [Pseudomonas gingeri]